MLEILGLAAALRIAALNPPEGSVPRPVPSSAAFERIKALVGDWEGSSRWSGARTDTAKMKATYYATAGASAIVENLIVDGEPVMTSVYHMDNGALRMTHYCGAGNQPRLRAEHPDDSAGTVRFALVDVTNLAGPKAPHVDGFEIQFVDAGHVVLTFSFVADGAVSKERIDLLRTGRAGPGKG